MTIVTKREPENPWDGVKQMCIRDRIYMVGAPLQQRRTDRNCKLGYWKIYEDFSMEFKPFKGFPKFVDVSSEDEIKDDGNYYTVIASKSRVVAVEDAPQITRELTKKTMVRRYMLSLIHI